MMKIKEKSLQFYFDEEIANEVILYLAHRVKKPTRLTICKLLYLADKLHLQEWGIPLCGEHYVAMEHGPVPSNIYDWFKAAAKGDDRYGFRVEGRNIQPQRPANPRHLSKATVSSLNRVLEQYGELTSSQLRELSHDSAWRQARNSLPDVKSIPMPIESIVAQLNNAEELLAYLRNDGY